MLANAVDALNAGIDALGEFDWAGMPVRERMAAAEAMETAARRLRAVSGTAFASLACETTEALGGRPHNVIAERLRISPAEARRRLREAGPVAERATLTGQPVPPILENTAKQWHAGALDPEHVKVIAGCLADLPAEVPFDKKQWAEQFLADKAAQLRPDQLAKVARRLAATLNPDGNFSDVDRARKRGVVIGRQHTDGMSPISGWLNPELRASLDAVLGKLAAPGMCNPEDQSPRVDGDPDPEVAGRDRRSTPQRNHDALLAMCRSILASGELGSHHGLPVRIIVSATLDQLEKGTGYAVTGSGTLLSMRDVIRLACHAYLDLAVFDRHSDCPLYLGRTRRTASAFQRIMLHATDRGCSHPGCTVPGYLCEVDHITDWANGGPTDIDNLTFACGTHHKLKTNGGWTVRKRKDGRTEWIPPPQLELPGGVNDFHHPERFLPDEE